jgi:hypothetical protein
MRPRTGTNPGLEPNLLWSISLSPKAKTERTTWIEDSRPRSRARPGFPGPTRSTYSQTPSNPKAARHSREMAKSGAARPSSRSSTARRPTRESEGPKPRGREPIQSLLAQSTERPKPNGRLILEPTREPKPSRRSAKEIRAKVRFPSGGQLSNLPTWRPIPVRSPLPSSVKITDCGSMFPDRYVSGGSLRLKTLCQHPKRVPRGHYNLRPTGALRTSIPTETYNTRL